MLFSLFLIEIGLRFVLFNDIPGFGKLRNPAHYANRFSDDEFFELRYLLLPGQYGMAQGKPPHPILGWVGELLPDNLVHPEAENVGDRRPVLLYGDSFAQCVSRDVRCFQDILNSDPEFSKDHYLLNYGISGYGVDQIYLLLENSVDLYDDPFVIVSFMTLDLDRDVLAFRGQPKPYFEVEDGVLKLRGTPVTLYRTEYISANPPQIRSYFYRLLLYHSLFPEALRSFLGGEEELIEKKKELGGKLIEEMVEALETRGIDYVFVIFHPHYPGVSILDGVSDWRDPWLKRLLDDGDIPYIWSKALYERAAAAGESAPSAYIIPGDGHPTTLFNELIAEEMKRAILGGPE